MTENQTDALPIDQIAQEIADIAKDGRPIYGTVYAALRQERERADLAPQPVTGDRKAALDDCDAIEEYLINACGPEHGHGNFDRIRAALTNTSADDLAQALEPYINAHHVRKHNTNDKPAYALTVWGSDIDRAKKALAAYERKAAL